MTENSKDGTTKAVNRRSARLALAALLFLLGAFSIPVHLAFENHDWDGHHEDSDHHDSSQESHPASDHDVGAIAVPAKAKPVHLELALVGLVEWAPEPQPEVFIPEVEVQDPSKVPETSRAGSRAPPLL